MTKPKPPADYQHISFLPILPKVCEKSLPQSGYQKNNFATTLLLKMKGDIDKAMKYGEIMLSVLVHLSKFL